MEGDRELLEVAVEIVPHLRDGAIADLREPHACGIHRDFYADQVIAADARLTLVDLDLYAAGDPALDVGNFLAHLMEQSLRERGDPEALHDREEALRGRFLELAPDVSRAAVEAYTTLSLARHVFLSTRFPERRCFTGALLELCEKRLGLAAGGVRA